VVPREFAPDFLPARNRAQPTDRCGVENQLFFDETPLTMGMEEQKRGDPCPLMSL